jgi:hypothetical protein
VKIGDRPAWRASSIRFESGGWPWAAPNNGSGSWGAAPAFYGQGAAFNPMQPMNQFTDPNNTVGRGSFWSVRRSGLPGRNLRAGGRGISWILARLLVCVREGKDDRGRGRQEGPQTVGCLATSPRTSFARSSRALARLPMCRSSRSEFGGVVGWPAGWGLG